jgi:uncharacterized protein
VNVPKGTELYLDVETDWQRRLTVVGFRSKETGLVQLVGEEITATRLGRVLPATGKLFTYNGHSFDLACIRTQLGLELRDRFESVDLRWVCQRQGLTGGQKLIEERLGFRRRLEGLDGRDAIRLWKAHRAGDRNALADLLAYNAEDLDGMAHIRRKIGLFD